MFSFKFKKAVTKTISMLVFSLFAFPNTAFAERHAKVVILGSIGAGKTTIKNLLMKNFKPVFHTMQTSYYGVSVFYDNNGNFTFDEDEAYDKKYKKEVILDICDTPADNKFLGCVNEFLRLGTQVAVVLADAGNFKLRTLTYNDNERKNGISHEMFEFSNHFCKTMDVVNSISKKAGTRVIVILTHANNADIKSLPFTKSTLSTMKNDFDAFKILTLFDGEFVEEESEVKAEKPKKKKKGKKAKKEEVKKEINEIKPESKKLEEEEEEEESDEEPKKEIIKMPWKFSAPAQIQSNVASVEYLFKQEECFNKNSKKELNEYIKVIMNLIAKSVWKYGIDKLPKSDADSNYHIEAVEKHNVEHKNIEVPVKGVMVPVKGVMGLPILSYKKDYPTTTITTDKVTTTTELKLVAGKATK